MNKKKTIEELEKELKNLKESHKSMWDIYGSELCAGDMSHEEEILEKEIERRKAEEELRYIEDVSQIIDN